MFFRKPRKTFRVSTSRVYIAGRKSKITKLMQFVRPYASRAGYRSAGALVAL